MDALCEWSPFSQNRQVSVAISWLSAVLGCNIVFVVTQFCLWKPSFIKINSACFVPDCIVSHKSTLNPWAIIQSWYIKFHRNEVYTMEFYELTFWWLIFTGNIIGLCFIRTLKQLCLSVWQKDTFVIVSFLQGDPRSWQVGSTNFSCFAIAV